MLALCYSNISSIASKSYCIISVPFKSKYNNPLLSYTEDNNNSPPLFPREFHLKSNESNVVFYLRAFANDSI